MDTPLDWARFQAQAMAEWHFLMLVDQANNGTFPCPQTHIDALNQVAKELKESKNKITPIIVKRKKPIKEVSLLDFLEE